MLRGMIFIYDSFFLFPNFLKSRYFVTFATSYDFQSVNNVFALLPLCYFVTCMSYSLEKVFNYFGGKKGKFPYANFSSVSKFLEITRYFVTFATSYDFQSMYLRAI